MATLKQYYETDFSNAVRIVVNFPHDGVCYAGAVHYDLVAHTAFISCYVPGDDKDYEFFREFLEKLNYGQSKVEFTGQIILPAAKTFPGALTVNRGDELEFSYKLFGDYTWRNAREITTSTRVFIYAESPLTPDEVTRLQQEVMKLEHRLQFRSKDYVESRVQFEHPLAFISHDSRDKDAVARPLAISLLRMLCPVWYDEFSLRVGMTLRQNFEKGVKECKKCILVLSPNFLQNEGWTKKEFDSVFSREILEETSLVLPIWYRVTKQQVFDYCPSLVNVLGLDWELLGAEETCKHLFES